MQLINLSTDVYLYKKQERFELMSCQSQVKYLTTYESLILYLRLLLYFSLFNQFNLHFTFFSSYLISLYLPCSLSLSITPLFLFNLSIYLSIFSFSAWGYGGSSSITIIIHLNAKDFLDLTFYCFNEPVNPRFLTPNLSSHLGIGT